MIKKILFGVLILFCSCSLEQKIKNLENLNDSSTTNLIEDTQKFLKQNISKDLNLKINEIDSVICDDILMITSKLDDRFLIKHRSISLYEYYSMNDSINFNKLLNKFITNHYQAQRSYNYSYYTNHTMVYSIILKTDTVYCIQEKGVYTKYIPKSTKELEKLYNSSLLEYNKIVNSYKYKTTKKLEKEGFSDREIECVFKNQIFIGMSEKALIRSWGKPERINTSVGSWGTHKQYCYGSGQYVYLENGVIKSWQN